ncbi:MAG: copper chaperone PCu(A)C [Salinibacter sp.]
MLPSFSSSTLRGLVALLGGVLLLGACQSQTTSDQQQTGPLPEGELTIENPWVRPGARGDTTALYLTIANGRSNADTLVGARQAPLYQGVQLFAADTTAPGGTRPVDSLIVPPMTRTYLAPDSAYVSLIRLNQPLKKGETVLVTLDFAQGGLQQVQASVRTRPPSEE